jgi:Uma2 family endonuclease
MTDEAKAAKIAEYQARTPEGWTFNPETLTYIPPEAPPT